ITDIIVSIVAVIIPAIGTYVIKLLKNHKQIELALAFLKPVADYGILVAQKLGAVDYLEGQAKKNIAISKAQDKLQQLGFDKADENLLATTIKTQYLAIADELNRSIPQVTKEQADQAAKQAQLKQEQDAAKAKADALAAAQADLKNAQAKVAELSK
ncbi:hypothetical protein Q757_08145, partial [Oenococcus alcoholitolerans]